MNCGINHLSNNIFKRDISLMFFSFFYCQQNNIMKEYFLRLSVSFYNIDKAIFIWR